MKAVALLVGAAIVAGCSLGDLPTPRATYRPLPDAAVYARIAEIRGVTRVDLNWTNGFDNPNGYGGTIYAIAGADAVEVLDRALAILRQGRPAADLGGVEVAPEGAFAMFPSDLGLSTDADYTARYGPQPGTGIPPPTPLHRVR